MKILVSDTLGINQAPELLVITLSIVNKYGAFSGTTHGDGFGLGM